MIDQFVVTMCIANIQEAHKGLLGKQIVYGALPYGFTGEPMEGQFTKQGQPSRKIVIDPVAADVVRQIFAWFIDDKLPLDQIVRLLNNAQCQSARKTSQ